MSAQNKPTVYRFSFGPWNISTGADPFGPPVRQEMEFARKLKAYKELGFDAVQFHDDDIVPADLDWPSTVKGVRDVKRILDGEGLAVEIVAPRLWEDPRTIDGAFTSNDPGDRKYALDRSRRCVDIAREIGCRNYVFWLAREGTYIREAKCGKTAIARIVDAWNAILEHDKEIRVLGEAKPNEPMDQAYLPTVGHMVGVACKTIDPSRSGVLIESAHSILAGLDPADDMAYALYHDKLWSVHLNDQNGLKYDQDKVFGSVDPAPRLQSGLGPREKRLWPEWRVRRPRRQGDAHHHVRGVDVPSGSLENHVPAAAGRRARAGNAQGRRAPGKAAV